ncbi:hypothetical protein [uncultured Bartonella sp.]|uniref:hypothetical protein n=1 Tax=uncultured Bartonella sp. TaxID=104108 RepID=UPI0025E57913|nr:hypothetical protein [uncultured Bartonella sp.]
METGLYKNIEKKFNNNVHYLIKKIPLFLKDNYLFLCVFCVFLWFFCAFYPGTVANDSFEMLKEAVHNNIGNWHSPLISRFFQLILSITSIKGIFVLVFMIPFFLGLYIIARNISKGIFTGLLCIIILFIPPVFVFVPVALKDTYIASFAFLISALMIDGAISDKKRTAVFYAFSVFILVCCFYLRPNACFIAVPLLIAIFMGWKTPIIYRYISCLVLVLCVIASTPLVNFKLLGARDDAPDFSLMIFDVAGTAKYSGVSTLPDIPGVPDQVNLFQKCYSPLQWDAVANWTGPDCNGVGYYFYHERDSGKERLMAARQELRKAWIAAITQHPVAYLKHRLAHFNRFIDYLGYEPVYRPIYITTVGFTVGYGDPDYSLFYLVKPPRLWNSVINMDLANQLWFHPYVSLLILLFFYLATLTTNDRFNRTLNVVAFSGLTYFVGFLFVGVSSDFRYCYPSLLLSILCILAALGYYSQKRQVFGNRTTRIIATAVTVPLLLIGIIF